MSYAPSPSSSSRNVLLRIPNTKASRVDPSSEQLSFLALGELVVYQVIISINTSAINTSRSSPSPSPSPARSTPPPIPPRSPVDGPRRDSAIPPPLPPPSNSTSTTADGSGIVLSVRGTDFPLSSSCHVYFEQPNSYTLDNGNGYIVKLEMETPRNGTHEILDNVLRRYGNLGGGDSTSGTSSGTATPNPQDYRGQLILMDEATGKMLGPLNESMPVHEHSNNQNQSIASSSQGLQPGSFSDSDPVVVSFDNQDPTSTGGNATVEVSPFSDLTSEYGRSNSRIVGAAEYVSKGILFAAEYGANATNNAARNYTSQTKATETPLVFSDTTKKGVAAVAGATNTAAKFTRSAVGFIGGKAEQLGASVGNRFGGEGGKPGGDPNKGFRGYVRQGVQAINTVVDGVERGGKHFLNTANESTSAVVGHRYGSEAQGLSDQITSAGSNVVLCYVDARGVMHRALLKRAGKGALRAQMKDGREIVLDDPGLEKSQGMHAERDSQGNLVVVDERDGGKRYDERLQDQVERQEGGYSTSYQQQTASRNPPPVPRRLGAAFGASSANVQ